MTIVPTNPFFARAGADMTALRQRAEELQAQISTGERLTHGSQDPVAASRLRELARAEGLAQADKANADRAIGELTQADDTLDEIATNLVRARELATQAANGTLNPAQLSAIGEEIAAIRQTVFALANSTDISGHALFAGEGTGAAYTLDGFGNAVYAGTAAAGDIPLGDGQSVTRGVTGPEAFDFTHAGSPTDIMAVLATLAAALTGGSPDPAAAARDGMQALETGLDRVTSTQTLIGTRMNWVELTMERQIRGDELRADEQTALGSTDLAGTITELQQILTVLEASQASFARLSGLTLFDAIR
jgi:flagellar hook-associated protein 3 FlgL